MIEKGSCFKDILKVIDVLQKNTNECPFIDTGCKRPFLGNLPSTICFNTRPITFYKCDSSILSLDYTAESTTLQTTVFRIEEVYEKSVKVLLLAPNPDTTDPTMPYISTNQYATINLGCICAIKCLPDVVLNY